MKKSGIITNFDEYRINLQLHADPPAPEVNDLSEEEFINQIAEFPTVDSNDPESIEEFLKESEEGGEKPKEGEIKEGEEPPATDDPYAFIKKHTSFTDQETIVDGYKNLQGHATKETERANKLQEELDVINSGRVPEKAPAVDDLGEPIPEKQLTKEDIISILAEERKTANEEDKKNRVEEQEQTRLDANYAEITTVEGWHENADKVYGIIREYPTIANNPSIVNPYKLALEMAKDPELMKVYNKYPELLESSGGGLRIAQGFIPGAPEKVTKIIDDAQNKAKDEETIRQIELQKSTVAAPSPGDTGGGEKDVNDMTKEEVYKQLNYTPDDD